MESFKIKVTPEQSKIVQEEMFKREYQWFVYNTCVSFTNRPFIFFHSNGRIYHSNSQDLFVADELPELTFEEFEAKYLKS